MLSKVPSMVTPCSKNARALTFEDSCPRGIIPSNDPHEATTLYSKKDRRCHQISPGTHTDTQIQTRKASNHITRIPLTHAYQDSLDTEAMLVCLKFSTLQYSGPHKQGDTATSAVKAVEDDEGRRRGQGGREKPEAEHEYHVQDVYFTDPVLGKEEVSTGSGNSSEKQQGRVTLQDVIEKLNVVQAQQERMQAQQDQLALLLRGLGPQTCATETTRDTEEKVEQPHHHRDHVNAYGHGKNGGSVPIDAEFSVRLSPASTPETPQSEADLKTHASGSS